IMQFSGKELIQGEPDASSFPSGGIRATFEARGYTAWDPTSPVFIGESEKGCILYIPSVFFGYNGKVLDKKTPLLRSLKLINDISLKLLKKFGQDVTWVKNQVGPEQEFFLFDEKDYYNRPDLRTLGRVVFAASPPKGQQMGDHYFGNIPEKVLRYLEDVEEQAMELGIPVKTRHNEVAPNQFEIAPIYEEANIASDHNQMLMDLCLDTARRQGMVCLLHEKPFSFFNGSGKHINWSLSDSNGRNLLTPGKTRDTRLVFLSFLTGFIVGINRHNDLIQSILTSPGNELRLGGHEAPPSIISIFLGEELQSILRNIDAFVDGIIKEAPMIQVDEAVPAILHDMSDRNRTSPVAFTGNKFEFRMPGSSASIAFPISVMNLTVADGLDEVFQQIASFDDEKKILETLQNLINENSAIIFEGDNYGQEWREEAEKRGLFIPVSVPGTVDRLKHEKYIALFEKFNILNKDEVEARADVKIEMYYKTVEMELQVARYLLRAYVIPAALKNQKMLLGALKDFPKEVLDEEPGLLENQRGFIKRFAQKINKALDMAMVLDGDNEKLKEGTEREKAELCAKTIRPHLQEAVELVAKIEDRVDHKFWELPRVTDMLFR
ncbi:MAG: glutamine synthetase type III, partial [bacterium]|nr:glutamine synthetase type III [bacterium]